MAKYVSEDGVKAIRDWVKVHDNKSLYNLGYYDTITTNSDGTYTITRQTGYVDLGTLEWQYSSEKSYFYVAYAGIIEPSAYNIDFYGVTSKYKTTSWSDMNSGQDKSICYVVGYIRIKDTSYTDVASFKASLQGVILQYKLATSYTEKVEANHYARYNQKFVLEHNKSEAERSANLLELININTDLRGTSVNISNGTITVSGIATGSGGRTDKLSDVISLEPGTYCFKAFGNHSILLCLSKSDNSFFTSTDDIFTINETTEVYFGINVTQGAAYSDSCQVMLVKDSTPPTTYQPYEGKTIHEKDLGDKLGGYVTTNTAQTITGYKKYNSIGIDTINGATLGNAIMRQNPSTGEVIVGSTVRPLRLWGNQTRPSYSKNDGVSYSDLALLSDVPSIYGVSQLYRHDIHFDITNGDGIKCTFWSTSNEKINNFSQIPYLAFSNIQVKNVSSEAILNVVQWQNDRFLYYDSTISANLVGNMYDGVTAYYINGEPQL